MKDLVSMAALAAGLGLSGTAYAADAVGGSATAQTSIVFDFVGQCTDCSGQGKAELALKNYAYNDPITAANFISFHYDGTNLASAFTIVAPAYIGGSITGPGPSYQNFSVTDSMSTFNAFFSNSDGYWGVGLDDYGTLGTYSVASSTAAVPEPASWAMIIVGMGAIGFGLRRRQKVTTRVSYAA